MDYVFIFPFPRSEDYRRKVWLAWLHLNSVRWEKSEVRDFCWAILHFSTFQVWTLVTVFSTTCQHIKFHVFKFNLAFTRTCMPVHTPDINEKAQWKVHTHAYRCCNSFIWHTSTCKWYIRTHSRTHAHTRAHACTHELTHTHKRTRTHTHTHKNMLAHTHIHTYIHAHVLCIYECVCVRELIHVCVFICVCVCIYIYTYIDVEIYW